MEIELQHLIKNIKEKLLSVCQTQHEAEQQAWWLLEKLTQKSNAQILAKKTLTLSEEQETTLDKWIHQRTVEKKPLQYILEHIPFCNVDIIVQPPILIPRPETENWVSWLIEKLKKLENNNLNILDMCSGTGCIALALAKAFPDSTVIGTDINPQAIELSLKNKQLNKIKNVQFLQSNYYEKIEKNKKFDLIVSNPPYISKEDWELLSDTVKKWEDKKALVAEKNGLAAFEKIIHHIKDYLKENMKFKKFNIPQMIFEIGMGQENAVKKLLENNNFKNINVFKDLKGINRWITASIQT